MRLVAFGRSTIAVAVAVVVTVMYPLWAHGMTVVIAIGNVVMTRGLCSQYHIMSVLA